LAAGVGVELDDFAQDFDLGAGVGVAQKLDCCDAIDSLMEGITLTGITDGTCGGEDPCLQVYEWVYKLSKSSKII
jgi:hypothetical protein